MTHLKVYTLALVRYDEEWINGALGTAGLLPGGGVGQGEEKVIVKKKIQYIWFNIYNH